jgi:hypothetical protein
VPLLVFADLPLMKTTLLKFLSLRDLAQFVKQANPAGYLLNTLELTVMARFSENEISFAIVQLKAKELGPAA